MQAAEDMDAEIPFETFYITPAAAFLRRFE